MTAAAEDLPFSAPAASRYRTPRSGSCGRPAARCPSTARSGQGIPMLEACTAAGLIAEITLQPLRRYEVDAAILFSDIVVPLRAIGVGLEIKPGRRAGGRTPDPDAGDLERLRPLEPGDVPYVTEAVRALVGELGDNAADRLRRRAVHAGVLPDRGRPVEEPRPHQGPHVRRPGRCGTRCSAGWPTSPSRSCGCRSTAGAGAVQLFDSWVGAVSPEDYRRASCRTASRIFAALAVPACRGSTSAWAPANCSA